MPIGGYYISGYYINGYYGYWWLFFSGYFLMAICCYSINDY